MDDILDLVHANLTAVSHLLNVDEPEAAKKSVDALLFVLQCRVEQKLHS